MPSFFFLLFFSELPLQDMSCAFIAELDEPENLVWKLVNDGSEHMSRLKLYFTTLVSPPIRFECKDGW
jgi:hypothetical protein